MLESNLFLAPEVHKEELNYVSQHWDNINWRTRTSYDCSSGVKKFQAKGLGMSLLPLWLGL